MIFSLGRQQTLIPAAESCPKSHAKASWTDSDPEEQLQAGLPHWTGLSSLGALSRAWKESDGTGLQNPEWRGNERAPTTNLINGSEGWNLMKWSGSMSNTN